MKKLVKIVSWLFAIGSIFLIAGGFYIFAVMVPALPSIDHLEDTQYQVPLRVYDVNEVLLAEFGEHRRIPVDFDKIPRDLIDAVVAVEDDQFWSHVGVDFYALLAAAYEVATTGNKTRGGSTITMQVARNFFLSPEQTYTRKFNEILLALKIESELSKEKIMELYLNKIFLGHRAYGISAASQVYYDKKLDELTVAQAAMIAGLPKAPSKYNPISNPERALIRRNYILGRMRVLGYLDEDEFDLAVGEPITAELHRARTIPGAQYVSELVRAELYAEYGDEIYKAGLKVYTSIDGAMQASANEALRRTLLDYSRRHGYRGISGHLDLAQIEVDPFEEDLITDERIGGLRKGVVVSVNEAEPLADEAAAAEDSDKPAQLPASATVLISNYEQIVIPFEGSIDWAAPYEDEDNQGDKPTRVGDVLQIGDIVWLEQRGEQWLLAQVPLVEGALVSINPSDGGIRAMVGGFDYFKNKFNRATQARRQPGSNFKPFIYSAALEKGYTAATIINDAPVVFDDDSLEATWRPENYSGKFYGPTRLREALVKSRNLVSIRVLQSIGLRYAIKYLERFGFARDRMPYDLSLALGSGSFSPLEMVRGYAVFSNGGYLVDPFIISRVESGTGEVLFEHNPTRVCQGCESENLDELAAVEAAAESAVLEEAELDLQKRLEAEEMALQESVETTPVENQESGEPVALEEEADGEKSSEEKLEDTVVEPLYAPRVISAQNAFIMRSIMQEVVQRGTAVRAKALGRKDLAGKTGTTNDQIDAWFSGFNDQVVTTAWVGFDNHRKMGRRETGGRAALPMWIDFMRYALEGRPENLREEPAGLVTIRIDAETGKRADLDTQKSLFEVFREENAPAEAAAATTTVSDEGVGVVITVPETEDEIVEDIF